MQRLTIFGVCALLVFAIFGAGCGSNISAAEIKAAVQANAAANSASFARLGKDRRETIQATFMTKQAFLKGFSKEELEKNTVKSESSKDTLSGETLFDIYATRGGLYQVDNVEGGANFTPTQKALALAAGWPRVVKDGTEMFERAIRIVTDQEEVGEIWDRKDGKTGNAKVTVVRHLEPGFAEFEAFLKENFKDQVELGKIVLNVDLEKDSEGKWKVSSVTRDPGVTATTAASLSDADAAKLVETDLPEFPVSPSIKVPFMVPVNSGKFQGIGGYEVQFGFATQREKEIWEYSWAVLSSAEMLGSNPVLGFKFTTPKGEAYFKEFQGDNRVFKATHVNGTDWPVRIGILPLKFTYEVTKSAGAKPNEVTIHFSKRLALDEPFAGLDNYIRYLDKIVDTGGYKTGQYNNETFPVVQEGSFTFHFEYGRWVKI